VAPGLINVNGLGVQEIDQESTSNDGIIGGKTTELSNVLAANGVIYNSKHHYAAAVSFFFFLLLPSARLIDNRRPEVF